MGIVDVARDALKEIPLSEVLRERVSLALDRLSDAEKKIELLQTENGGLKAQLEREQVDHAQTKQKLQQLEEILKEEVRFVSDIEFRKGTRTGGIWKPFCPKCHLPVVIPEMPHYPALCSDRKCGWESALQAREIRSAQLQELRR